MRISQIGIDFIKDFEKCKTTAYQDSVGVWTIGYGHTGTEVKKGLVWSQEKCEKQFQEDLDSHCEDVVRSLGTAIATQGQFDALCSFAFNLGAHALRRSTLLDKFLRGDIQGAADEFERWNMAGGKASAGLTRRREGERDIFLS